MKMIPEKNTESD